MLAALGLGGVTYGVVEFLKKRNNRLKKEEKKPEEK